MFSLTKDAELLESEEPQILEEYSGFEVIHELSNSTQFMTKYQVWGELEKLLRLAPINDRVDCADYLRHKLLNF